MRRRLSSLLCLGFCACGARLAVTSESVAPPPAPSAGVVYERILGSFSASHDAVIYLDPVLCQQVTGDDAAEAQLRLVAGHFHDVGMPRGEAAARLNRAAILVRRGEPDEAYRELVVAQDLFHQSGDVVGLAHSYEWLGYLFLQAGAGADAGEQLAVAYQLFRRLENQPAMERVLSYGE